ncbi:hypothetical protein [Winogradskyella alexanderae]|uniref:Glycerophosphoryl diester phosphodiesterase membrane domain-containing protein n=1 Tax=Winogradskyella alexanderae TaxID=2877123 RepID=A0ABS7XTS6_9FLAO|nr:hypothetical protein [Winogradskyella alexanderae]MCA0132307.1 hypothetical protein [Winogradskyella alexanderae]
MNRKFIEFRKQSDFSGILTDTFGFIRNEFKPLMKMVITIAGPAILVYLLSLAVYNYVAGDIFNITSVGNPEVNSGSLAISILAFFVYAISAIATYILIGGTVLYYIKSYIDNKGVVDYEEIKGNTYKAIGAFFGLGVLKVITLFFATMLCVLPVFYAMVPMAVVFSLYVFETENSVTDAYSKSFYLVNADFWTAWGSYIVLFIIYYIIIVVFALPSSIYAMISTGIFSGEIDPANINEFSRDPILIVLSVLQAFVQVLLNVILVIGGAAIYFHLHEKTSFTGTYERINEIGKIEE